MQALSPEARKATKLRGTDEAVPTLTEVLDILAPATGIDLHVEIKIDETGTPYPGIAARVAAELARFGIEERSYLTSFDTSVLEDCRRHAPQVSRLVSVNAAWAEKQGGLAAFLDRVDGLAELVAIHQDLMEAEWELIRSKLPLERLCVWTVNEEAAIRHWLARGVGSLTTDSPDLALKLRAAAVA